MILLISSADPAVTSATELSRRNGTTTFGRGRVPAAAVETARS